MAPKVFFFLLTSLLLFFHTFAKNVETSTTENEPFKNQNLWHPRPWLKRGPHPPLPAGWGHWPHPHPPLPAGWAHKPHPPMPAGGWSQWPPHLPIRGSPFWPRYPGFRGGWRWLPHPPLPSKQSKVASTSDERSNEVEALASGIIHNSHASALVRRCHNGRSLTRQCPNGRSLTRQCPTGRSHILHCLLGCLNSNGLSLSRRSLRVGPGGRGYRTMTEKVSKNPRPWQANALQLLQRLRIA
ncbi:unnamed protein product [Cuscuta europaea]|uniref:Uncharacterized protein n=1 Tax=Cuscuta europaea TaxID=41803 RepID=A0A9P0ZQH5_CUSEU|nr:unnamed protein product [Cuscuta europaea]